MQTRTKITGCILRNAGLAVFFSGDLIAFCWALNTPDSWYKSLGASDASDITAPIANQSRAFSFAERVGFQRAIEEVYWRHRIWSKENIDLKPAFDAVMSRYQ